MMLDLFLFSLRTFQTNDKK